MVLHMILFILAPYTLMRYTLSLTIPMYKFTERYTFSCAATTTTLHVCSVRSKQANEPRVRDNEPVIAYSRWKLTSPLLL